MKLVIVESPAKARTIEKFLGSEYQVEASYGHIRDLPGSADEIPARVRAQPWATLAVDVEHDFAPIYVVPKDSQKRVRELRKMVSAADELLLATDEDREGESISWHLVEVLEPKVPVRRITFHEITRSALEEALANPRAVDEQLVRAQETRRILDRLYGYSLSPVLWKKVRTKLSAGRVQSVALRLVVEREEERQAFHTAEYWDVRARLAAPQGELTADLVAIDGTRLASGKDFDADSGQLLADAAVRLLGEQEATAIAQAAPAATPWVVTRVERKETRQRPAPPFTTSTLQQAASSRLRMSPKQTMAVAQRLYEGIELGGGEREGLITYMRTDSLTLSEKALADAGGYIRETFGDAYHGGARRYRTSAKSAQEAHEAIRPTEITRTPEAVAPRLQREELALYRLIWERAVASQMSDALLDNSTLELTATVNDTAHTFRATGSILRFPGFLRVAGGDRQDVILPPLEEGDRVGGAGAADTGVRVLGAAPERHETRPPARYTEASLIKKLEEEGIGRPSTYTPTLSTLQDREYVIKKAGYLVPTFVGMAVIHLLRRHFPQYVDVKFTARMEEALDDIAAGERDWKDFLASFYFGEGGHGVGLAQRIDDELPKIEYPSIRVGDDPESGQPIEVRIGRSNVYVQRGEGGEGDRVTLPVDLLIDELTAEKVLELLAARSRAEEPLGTDPESGQQVYARLGPYGAYVQLGESADGAKPKRVSLPRGKGVDDVDLDYALRLLALPRVLGTDPDSGSPVTAGLGRYGPYVERGGRYKNLRQEDEVFTVTLEQALALLAQAGRTVLKELGPHPDTGRTLEVLSGRYGPYVTDGKTNASLPRGADPEALSREEALALLAEREKKGPGKRPRRGAKGGKGGKKSPAGKGRKK
ncbi:MAG TPA: type I DNA topoisomerase [Thermoanaerobaculia bacterium]|nr:type I DNA topoisomerase [Thermoanaerobaculia bacterium]